MASSYARALVNCRRLDNSLADPAWRRRIAAGTDPVRSGYGQPPGDPRPHRRRAPSHLERFASDFRRQLEIALWRVMTQSRHSTLVPLLETDQLGLIEEGSVFPDLL